MKKKEREEIIKRKKDKRQIQEERQKEREKTREKQ